MVLGKLIESVSNFAGRFSNPPVTSDTIDIANTEFFNRSGLSVDVYDELLDFYVPHHPRRRMSPETAATARRINSGVASSSNVTK